MKREASHSYSDEDSQEEYVRNGGFGLVVVFSWCAMLYMLVMTVVIFPIVLLVALALIATFRYVNTDLYFYLKSFFARVLSFQFVICARTAGISVDVYGENLEKVKFERCLVLPNHLGLIDHFLFMTSLDQFGMGLVGKWIFIIFNVWKNSPLGYLWYVYGNYFIDTVHPSKRENQLAQMRDYFEKNYYEEDMRWVVLFPEGSRLFLIQKKNREFEKKFDLPKLSHCAYPRLGAAVSVCKVLGPKENDLKVSNCGKGGPLKYLIDVTLGYPDGNVMTIDQMFHKSWVLGESKQFAVHYEVFDIDPKWSDEEELKKFLFERAQAKDRLLDEFYKTGKFPGVAKPAPIPSDLVMFLSHLVVLAAFYIICKIFSGFVGIIL